MGNRLKFTARWLSVFVVLIFFTFQGIGYMSYDNMVEKAYAQNVSNIENNGRANIYVSFEADRERGNPNRGRKGWFNRFHRNPRMVCRINQTQLDALRAEFETNVRSVFVKNRGEVPIVEVVGDADTNKRDIYEVIDVNPRAKHCQIVQFQSLFFMFLLPGVS